MSKELQIFNNPDFGEIRVVIKDGEPWFVAKDVCEILDISTEQIRRLDDDEKGLRSMQTPGGEQEMSIVSEAGLYNLVLGSKKTQAKPFKRWVTHEVLPSIRKHGAYLTPAMTEEILLNPDTLIRLATELKNSRENNRKLELEKARLQVHNAIMQPKAEYFDELVERNLLTNIRTAAKEIGVGEKEFIAFLVAKKYLYRNKKSQLEPYAKKNKGLFEVKECFNDKTNWKGTQTLITPKGRETFRLLMKGGL